MLRAGVISKGTGLFKAVQKRKWTTAKKGSSQGFQGCLNMRAGQLPVPVVDACYITSERVISTDAVSGTSLVTLRSPYA